jgi:dTDP-4-amino-4,6-dideoxygalactose transaminase
MKIPFSPPYIDQDVVESVMESLNSGWITSGPKVKALEEEVARYVGVKRAVCVNSWTSGAILMMKWFGLKKGDEVIIPAYTYAATALSVIHAGAKPVMVDVGDDFMIDPEAINNVITDKTKIIIPVDFGGWLSDYDRINQISQDLSDVFNPENDIQQKLGRILILSDAAHSLGASINGRMSGGLCDVSVFSFHAVKNVTTAEGGAICLNLPDLFDENEQADWLKLMTLNGQTKDAFTKTKAGGWKYDIVMPGMKINLPDIAAAIGLVQLKKYEILRSERKRVHDRYLNAFKSFEWAIIPKISEIEDPSYHLFPLRINNISEAQRDKIISILAEQGIAVNVHFNPLPNLSYFKKLGYKISDFPNAHKLYLSEISLPIYPQLSDDNIDFLIEELVKAYEKVS